MKTIIFVTLFLFPTLIHAQITFEKFFGGLLNEQGKVILQTKEGGYIIAGNNKYKYFIRVGFIFTNIQAPFLEFNQKININLDILATYFDPWYGFATSITCFVIF